LETDLMKAILSKAPGGPETLVLEEVADPSPGASEVVLDVMACGVNYPDSLIIQDLYQYKPERPFSPGGEVSGIISAIGEGVTALKLGDRVIGSLGWGGMAEKVKTEARRCIPIPDAMPFDHAAAFIMTYGTSYYALKQRGRLKQGETQLVLGAAGGVGLAAVELGRLMGARVVAAVSSEEKLALAKAHGADEGVIYPSGPFDKDGEKALRDMFKSACGPGGADVIYDPVGGAYTEAALRAIAWEGRHLVVGFPAGIPKLPLNLTLLKSCQVVGVFWGEWVRRLPPENAENVRELLSFYAQGKIRPTISQSFPLARAGEAIDWLAGRKALGKVVVTME
jgi:NADPH2:quinone reductase